MLFTRYAAGKPAASPRTFVPIYTKRPEKILVLVYTRCNRTNIVRVMSLFMNRLTLAWILTMCLPFLVKQLQVGQTFQSAALQMKKSIPGGVKLFLIAVLSVSDN